MRITYLNVSFSNLIKICFYFPKGIIIHKGFLFYKIFILLGLFC